MNAVAPTLHIDLFHDTVCPWCRIGKRHLQLALADWDGPQPVVRYRTFFLNPDVPAGGYPFADYMRTKMGGRMTLEALFDGPRRAGAAVDLTFNFEQITRAPNTLDSHRLIALAPVAQRPALIDALYKAYFEDGRDIGERAELLALAAETGLDADAIATALAGEAATAEVLAEAEWARTHSISGVPFFVINGRYGVSGAQPPDVLRRFLDQIVAEAVQNA